jgi:hypothetical protein
VIMERRPASIVFPDNLQENEMRKMLIALTGASFAGDGRFSQCRDPPPRSRVASWLAPLASLASWMAPAPLAPRLASPLVNEGLRKEPFFISKIS